MKVISEPEKYFVVSEFEEGWGMEDIQCEEQLHDYCIDVLLIPDDKIEEISLDDNFNMEVALQDLTLEDISEDWYVNLMKISIQN